MSAPIQRGSSGKVLRDEPVSVAQVVHMVLAALVTIGWITIDSATADVIGTVIAGVISLAMQWWARSKVTPLAKPGAAKTEPLDIATGKHAKGEP